VHPGQGISFAHRDYYQYLMTARQGGFFFPSKKKCWCFLKSFSFYCLHKTARGKDPWDKIKNSATLVASSTLIGTHSKTSQSCFLWLVKKRVVTRGILILVAVEREKKHGDKTKFCFVCLSGQQLNEFRWTLTGNWCHNNCTQSPWPNSYNYLKLPKKFLWLYNLTSACLVSHPLQHNHFVVIFSCLFLWHCVCWL